MENKFIVTKEKIKKYLKNYIYLSRIIKARELKWILGRGPSLKEWQEGINTVEIQNLLKEQEISLLDNELVNYLYINLKSEVDRYDKH